MTPLQQELFDLSKDGLDTVCYTEEQLEADIKTLNAAELRHNIRVFKEADETIERLDPRRYS